MLLNASAGSLALLLACGATSAAAGSNLRRRRTTLFGHGAPHQQQQEQLLSPSASASDASDSQSDSGDHAPADEQLAAEGASLDEPSMSMDKSTYSEGEPIAVTFSVGAPSHPHYSSGEAASPAVDMDYPKWSVGLFMRDADPQGGTLDPVVSVNVCGALGPACDADDLGYHSYASVVVRFDSERSDLMEGRWPLEISQYGTGFDAYVLDGKGAVAIGPLQFQIRDEDDEEDSPSAYSAATAAAQLNTKIVSGNGLEMSNVVMSNAAAPSEPSAEEEFVAAMDTAGSTLTSDKSEYEWDESVSIDFSVPSSFAGGGGYRIGIFMRMAHPQAGTLPPIVSLPLCSEEGASECVADGDVTAGSVTFGPESAERMSGSGWPLDLYQWGTGYDAYVLDGMGNDMIGPVKFNILMDDAF